MVPVWFSELFDTRCDTKAETLKQKINVNKLGLVTVLQGKTQAHVRDLSRNNDGNSPQSICKNFSLARNSQRAWTLDFYH